MKKIFYTIIFSIIIFGCERAQKYSYIEIVDDLDVLTNQISEKEKEPVIFEAESDSAAFLEAYSKFLISVKSTKEVSEAMGGQMYTVQKDFKLLNEEGINIVSYTYSKYDFEKEMRNIEKLVFGNRINEFTKHKF